MHRNTEKPSNDKLSAKSQLSSLFNNKRRRTIKWNILHNKTKHNINQSTNIYSSTS